LNGKLNGSRVPYLNGGLFEPEKNKATLKIDFPADYLKNCWISLSNTILLLTKTALMTTK
jgi:hypothetical protein